MRVLVLIASPERRGAEIEAFNLVNELKRLGVDVEITALAGSKRHPLLNVAVLGERPLSFGTLRSLRTEASRYDITVAFGSSTLPACAIGLFGSGSQFVYRSIGDPRVWIRGRLHRHRTGILLRRAVRVFALWEGAAESICSMYRIPPENVVVIPNGRSVRDFTQTDVASRQDSRTQLGLPSSGLVVAVIGSLSGEKRVGLAIESVAKIPGVHLLVAGDGPERAKLEAIAAGLLSERAVFVGSVADVSTVYAACDAVLITSLTEGMPGVAIEAALCGLPVVSTNVGGVSEVVVHGETGMIASGEPGELSKALIRALECRESFGVAARTRAVQRFDSTKIVGDWVVNLESVST